MLHSSKIFSVFHSLALRLSLGAILGVTLSLLGATLSTACGGSGGNVCDECFDGQNAYTCNGGQLQCAVDDVQAANLCGGLGNWSSKVNCSGLQAPLTPYGFYDPDAAVSYDRQTAEFVVDKTFVDDVAADANVLFVKDSARLVSQTEGYYKLQWVGRDGLANHLGFRSGDVLLRVNEKDLTTLADYVAAITLLRGEPALSVEFIRDGQEYTTAIRIE